MTEHDLFEKIDGILYYNTEDPNDYILDWNKKAIYFRKRLSIKLLNKLQQQLEIISLFPSDAETLQIVFKVK